MFNQVWMKDEGWKIDGLWMNDGLIMDERFIDGGWIMDERCMNDGLMDWFINDWGKTDGCGWIDYGSLKE
jgi:hypothetical protein